MIRRILPVAAALLILGGFAGCKKQTVVKSPEICDRSCLQGFITEYLDAMLAHDPGSLPVAEGTKFTEDCKELKLGEGLWKNINSLTEYRRDILDVKQGVAVSYLVVKENDNPVMFVMRLKIADNRITEIETMVVRNREEGMLFNLDNLKTVSKGMTYTPTADQLNSREEMIKAALTYPAGLKVGSFMKVDSPMAEDAYRYENGNLMAGPGCKVFQGCDNMKKQMIPTLSEITHRVIAVDEKQGVVAVRMNFGKGSTFQGDGVLDVWHSFKIYDGLIHAAEAYCEIVPAGTPSGWD